MAWRVVIGVRRRCPWNGTANVETATPRERQEGNGVFECEKDSPYHLPLSMIPLAPRALRRAHLIKNARLRGARWGRRWALGERDSRGPSAGSLLQRIDFIMTDIRPGLENMRRIEGNAPVMAQLG